MACGKWRVASGVLGALAVSGVVWALWCCSPQAREAAALGRLERDGDLHFQKAENRKAERCWRAVLERNLESVSARNKLAVICMQEGRFEEASGLLAAGIRRAPQEVSYHFNAGLLCYMQTDYEGALDALSEVERLHSAHGEVHYLKGAIYEALGQSEQAQREFVKELNVDPATPEAWAKLMAYTGNTAK